MNTAEPIKITIVDDADNVIGSETRTIARQRGLIHRIVKVIVINPAGQILIQKRGAQMEDSPLKWDLSATGHVYSGEDYETAAHRETQEEIGLTKLKLTFIGKYYYEREVRSLMIRRFNAIFVGHTNQKPLPDPSEVAEIQWITPHNLTTRLKANPGEFTRSFSEIFDQFSNQILADKPVDHSRSN